MIRVPRPLLADAYTCGAGTHVAPQAKDYSAYQMVFRNRPKWMDDLGCESRFIFHGFQQVIRDVLQSPFNLTELHDTDAFLKDFHAGKKAFTWDRDMWSRIIREHKGIFPLRIWALPDGAVCFPGEPIMQTEAMDGFGELAGYFESKFLQVWATSERATLMRHWLDYNKKLVKRCVPGFVAENDLNDLAALMTHDFGDRAGSCEQESQVLGMAHLTSHSGTDTLEGAYCAWLDGFSQVGSSIKALAHRIVQGYDDEKDAYLALYLSEPNTFTSHVGDCFDFFNAVDSFLVPLAKQAKETGGVIVARPDSGDPIEQVLYVLEAAKNAGLYTQLSNGLKAMTHLRVIQGNEMTFKKVMEINDVLFDKGYSPFHCICYGIGGFLRNTIARDNFGATLKLCAVGAQKSPRMKFSHTPAKSSIPGLVKIVRSKDPNDPSVRHLNEPGDNAMVLWYDGIDHPERPFQYEELFLSVRNRVIHHFYNYPMPNNIFSQSILNTKKELRAKYLQGAASCVTPKQASF